MHLNIITMFFVVIMMTLASGKTLEKSSVDSSSEEDDSSSVELEDVYRKKDSCSDTCIGKYNDEDQSDSFEACEEGCRVHAVLQLTATGINDDSTVDDKCRKGCEDSYSNEKQTSACQYGCANQKPFSTNGNFEVSIDSSDAMFNVAKSAIDDIFGRAHQNFFGSNDLTNGPFDDMNSEMNRMSEIMRRIMSRTQDVFDDVGQQDSAKSPKSSSSNNHDELSFVGPSVGNTNADGDVILHVQIPLGETDGDEWRNIRPTIDDEQEQQQRNWVSCFTNRARRLSMLTQWLVCLALLLCVVCMMWICTLIIRQSANRRRLLEQRKSFANIYSPISTSLDAKNNKSKADFEPMDVPFLPTVHNSPPPAYDQLSGKH